ncbi:uncharacterized protein LOC142823415 [Pelodiscus sinensis]|uniref:uncharacterized protein LOC142823415 n=1 Tax=Pelodiscus sinensis TaxID=13735 RepID=UPI003F6B841E
MEQNLQCYILLCAMLAAVIPSSESLSFEVTSSPKVSGTIGQDVVLPCWISTGTQLENMEVQWKKIIQATAETVYDYKAQTGVDVTGEKYKGRAMLLKDGFASGNVSLKLKNVQPVDGGIYSCIVKSNAWSADNTTELYIPGDTCSDGSPWLAAFWVLFVLVFFMGVYVFWRCRAKEDSGRIPKEVRTTNEETADVEKGIGADNEQKPLIETHHPVETAHVKKETADVEKGASKQAIEGVSEQAIEGFGKQTTEGASKETHLPIQVFEEDFHMKEKELLHPGETVDMEKEALQKKNAITLEFCHSLPCSHYGIHLRGGKAMGYKLLLDLADGLGEVCRKGVNEKTGSCEREGLQGDLHECSKMIFKSN